MARHHDKKTITFDFDFNYSLNGQIVQASAITLCEPAYEHKAVRRKLQAYVALVRDTAQRRQNAAMLAALTPEQMMALDDQAAKRRAEFEAAQAEAAAAPQPAEKVEEPAAEEAAPDISLEWFAAELGVDEFAKFTDFLQKALTGNKALAYVGADQDQDPKERVAVQEAVWMNIDKAGGMDAVDRVLAGFASFFAVARPATSQTSSGSTSSVVLAAAHQAS